MTAGSQAGRLALATLAVGVVVLGLKYLAFALTGSFGLYSDAIESIVNVAAAGGAMVAVRISATPPDAAHPYGHSKAEYLSAVIEGVLIVVAAMLIIHEALNAFGHPRALDAPILGLAINGAATAINGVWGVVLIRAGARLRSPALSGDGRHLMTDVYTSVGVIGGVALAAATGIGALDPIVAILVALNVVWTGWKLVQDSIGGLMEHALPPEDLERVRAVVAAEMGEAIQAHDIRTRAAGRLVFIDFHLVVAGDMTVERSHAICDRIESALAQAFPDAVVTIHVEPPVRREGSGATVVMS